MDGKQRLGRSRSRPGETRPAVFADYLLLARISYDLHLSALPARAQDKPSLTLSTHTRYGCHAGFIEREAGLIITPPFSAQGLTVMKRRSKVVVRDIRICNKRMYEK
jgi:hypothetical protein